MHRRGLARLSAERARRADLRLSRLRPLRAAARPSLQSAQAAARSLCAAPRRRAALVRCAVRLSRELAARRPLLRPPRQRAGHAEGAWSATTASTGRDDRPPNVPWSDTVIYEAHVRGLTMLRHDLAPNERGTFAALARPARHRSPAAARRHRGRAAAGPRLRAGPQPAREGPAQLLGLQHPRLLRARAALPVRTARATRCASRCAACTPPASR